jgi:hypothetical protein
MECRNIQEKLSAYIDDILSSQEKTVVDEHLKTCRECTAALADMKKVIEHIKGLETVEPPVWMKQKIMAKVHAEARPKKGLFERLFYPLHVKLPVGAIATVAIALATLYVFRTIEPEVKLAKAPTEEVAPRISQKKQQPAQKEAEDRGVTPPVLPLDEGRSEEGLSLKGGKGEVAGKAAPAPERLAEQPSVLREADLKADKLAPSRAQELEKKEEAKFPAAAGSLEQAPATGTIAKGEARREPKAAAPVAKLSYMEKKKEEMLTLSVLVKDPEAAVGEIEKTLKELESKAVRAESAEGKKIITGEINATKLKELVARLKAVGNVKERKIDFESVKGEVKVKIEIVEIIEGR